MDLQAEFLINARDFVEVHFATLNKFVNEKGILELLDDKCQQYSLDFQQKMTAYTKWLQDPALPPRRELEVAKKMQSDFTDYSKNHYERFKRKWTVGLWDGSTDTNFGQEALIFTNNWYEVFTRLNKYIGRLEEKLSWSIYFKRGLRRLGLTRQVQDTQQVHHLLLQLKQCIEEP